MPVITQKFIFRSDLKNNPNVLYVFGDNSTRIGLGGQAKEMRGERNAIGLTTKRSPGMSDDDFFTDDDLDKVIAENASDIDILQQHVLLGGLIVIPEDGIGTGFSQLPERAPAILEYYEEVFNVLRELALTSD